MGTDFSFFFWGESMLGGCLLNPEGWRMGRKLWPFSENLFQLFVWKICSLVHWYSPYKQNMGRLNFILRAEFFWERRSHWDFWENFSTMAPNKSAPMKIIIQQGIEGQKRGLTDAGASTPLKRGRSLRPGKQTRGNNNHAHFHEYRVGEERVRGNWLSYISIYLHYIVFLSLSHSTAFYTPINKKLRYDLETSDAKAWLKWPSNVLQGHQKWYQSKASAWFPIISL